ncbi:heavy-metal-associated domain-containing protein [Chlorobium sp. KB01]|uniref:heavy-metal-associated domain-containing protein n=1 Tax=Chlorobium sp. KB01 TaxID=1917528 RepID=UPI000978AA2E|nr:cation transporter [Chlorobium sp. KB01]
MKQELVVTGMSCSGCEMLLKEALEELDGVQDAEASYHNGVVMVEFNPSKITLATITETIRAEGFTVKA